MVLKALSGCAEAFSRVSTFRSRVVGSFGTALVDYRAPGVFRVSGMQASSVLVGEQAYALEGHVWERIDAREATFFRDLVLTPRIMIKWARLTQPVFVREFLGAAGKTRIFRYISTSGNVQLFTTVWISERDSLPRFASYDTFEERTTVEYTDFNVKLDFAVPPAA